MDNYSLKKYISSKFPKRYSESNKGTYGRIYNLAGCSKYTGAAYLSSKSALKSGAGYVTLASGNKVCDSVSLLCPELTYCRLNSTETGYITANNDVTTIEGYDVISAGCGLSVENETKEFLFEILEKRNSTQKIILDADAINMTAKYKGEYLIKNTIITPHPKELSRLLKVDVKDLNENREKYARIAAQTFECITLLKGHNTIITDGDKLIVNPTGNSALAKAGTGDVLTGITAAMAAQGLSLFDAAIVAAYLHGLAGDIASRSLTEYCVMATDVINYIPQAIKEILHSD